MTYKTSSYPEDSTKASHYHNSSVRNMHAYSGRCKGQMGFRQYKIRKAEVLSRSRSACLKAIMYSGKMRLVGSRPDHISGDDPPQNNGLTHLFNVREKKGLSRSFSWWDGNLSHNRGESAETCESEPKAAGARLTQAKYPES